MNSAFVHENAIVAPDARIEPGAYIDAGVVVGEGAHIRVGTVLLPGTRVGAHTRIGPYAVIGGEPMDAAFSGEESFVEIGERCDIREFVTIHRATGAGKSTVIGPHSLLMSYVHASHNAIIGTGVTITTLSQLAGHVVVGDYANLGSGAMIHQYVHIGSYAMVGATSGVNRDILPFSLARGNLAKHYRANAVGLRRHEFSSAEISLLQRAFRALRTKNAEALAELAVESSHVRALQEFITASTRGISGFAGR